MYGISFILVAMGGMYMNNLQEKRETAKRELELKRIQAAVADIRIDMDVFNQIVAEFQEKHAAVIDLMVLDNAVCVFSLKRS